MKLSSLKCSCPKLPEGQPNILRRMMCSARSTAQDLLWNFSCETVHHPANFSSLFFLAASRVLIFFDRAFRSCKARILRTFLSRVSNLSCPSLNENKLNCPSVGEKN